MVDTNLMNFDGWILVMNAKFSFYEARYDLSDSALRGAPGAVSRGSKRDCRGPVRVSQSA